MQLYLSENKSKNIFKDAVDYYIHPQNTKKSFCLLICSLRNDFEGAIKVVLQSRIFFRLEKSGSAISDFFLVGYPEKKNLSLQSHFSATLKITSKVAD